MNNKYLTWGILVLVVVVVIVGAVVWRAGWLGASAVPGTASTNAGASSPASPYAGTATPSAQIVIKITAPVAGDAWKIGTTNSITWTRAANVTGYIYLINAQTKNLVGVITPQTGPQQTYYPWDTRHLALSQTDPSQKDVVPGTYYISMAFSGNHLPVISSPIFTIVD